MTRFTQSPPAYKSVWPPESAQTVREMIRHEDELTNQRITWVLTFEGFLFAALGLSENKSPVFTGILMCIGCVVAYSGGKTIRAGGRAVDQILQDWRAHCPSDYSGPNVIGLDERDWTWTRFLSLWYTLPVILIAGWIAIFLLSVTRVMTT